MFVDNSTRLFYCTKFILNSYSKFTSGEQTKVKYGIQVLKGGAQHSSGLRFSRDGPSIGVVFDSLIGLLLLNLP